MTTQTTFLKLYKPETGTVNWETLLGANWDILDQAANAGILTNVHASDMMAFDPVCFVATEGEFVAARLDVNFADGIALTDVAVDEEAVILTRGFVENAAWTWSIGDIIYLTSANALHGSNIGVLNTRGLLHIFAEPGDDNFRMQPVGIAISPTRAWFDFNRFRHLMPYTIPASGYIVTAGTMPQAFENVTGPGWTHVLKSSGGGATVIYTFKLPPWFLAMPDIADVWGFRLKYALSSGTIDVTELFDGNDNNDDPGLATGSSATWTNYTVDWDDFNNVAGWSPQPSGQIGVEVVVSAADALLEITPQLSFEPRPTIGV